MGRLRKGVKKSLVRNPNQQQPVSKTVDDVPQRASTSASAPNLAPRKPAESVRNNQSPGFDSPEMHSTLRISKKMDEIVKPIDISKNKLAVDDKVSSKVNFPPGEPVFKDLISLDSRQDITEVKAEQFIATRDPLEELDPEPNFEEYFQKLGEIARQKQKVYYYEPRIRDVQGLKKVDDGDKFYRPDGLRLYHRMLTHINDRDLFISKGSK